MLVFTTVKIHSYPFVLFYGIAAAMLLSVLGLITAIWAEKIDHVASINNFIILPLTFLSGTFYSTQHLPEIFQNIAHFNPFFYLIDGFRYGFLGVHDGHLATGITLLTSLIVFFWVVCVQLFTTGYKLKS
jgi:ABC-2 type transport system permease protein